MTEVEVKPDVSLLASPRGELPSDMAYSALPRDSTDSGGSLIGGGLLKSNFEIDA